MDFKYAIYQLTKGKKVRRPSWTEGSYLHVRGGQILNNKNESVDFSYINSMLATDWEVYEDSSLNSKMIEASYSQSRYSFVTGSVAKEEDLKKAVKSLKMLDIGNMTQEGYEYFVDKVFGANLI